MDVSQKNEGLLKRLKNIEGKNEQQLDLSRDQGEKQFDLIGKINIGNPTRIGYYDGKNKTAVDFVNEINKKIRTNKNKNFVFISTNGTQYDFNQYRDLNQFGNDIYSDEISLDEARDEQYNM